MFFCKNQEFSSDLFCCYSVFSYFCKNLVTPEWVLNYYIMRCIALLFLAVSFLPLHAQNDRGWEEYLARLMDAEDYSEENLSDVYDRLCELEESPLNINTASFDEIAQIPGLDMSRVSDIMEYRDRYGELKTIEELAMIPSIDRELRLFLSHFFVASPMEKTKWYSKEGLKRTLNSHKGNIIATMDVPLYMRKGYKPDDETGEKAYLGDKYKYGFRYTGKFGNQIKYGLVGAKDAGEQFFRGRNSDGMDYYSYFVSANNLGRIKTVVLGNYRVRFGMGLVINTNTSYGKQTALSAMSTVSNVITGHTSRSDATRLQGLATTISLGGMGANSKLELSAFYSYRGVDATLNKDGSVSTILTSGYHRTETEMGKKNNTRQMVSGGHLAWKYNGWHAGVTAVFDWFNRDLNPSWESDWYKYRRYNARGNSFWNIGADYGCISSRFSFTGETATGDGGAIATLNAVQAKVSDRLSLTAIQRFYSYRYHAIQSSSFSDGGKVQNESGVYLGARWDLAKYAVFEIYSDLSYSPWLKYQVHSSSYSFDNNASLTYDKGNWNILGRYRLRVKERDNSAKTGLSSRCDHRFRLSTTYSGDVFSFSTQADACIISFEGEAKKGWLIGGTVRCRVDSVWDITGNVSYFKADDYDSRLYTYEKSLLYSFSMPSYYGQGMRASLVVRADLGKHWMLMAKIGHTKYFDREVIGTSYQQVDSSYLDDIGLQFRYRF